MSGFITGVVSEGLVYGIMALGVFMTFRILDFPDLTVDGSFPLGGAVMATSLIHGFSFGTALLIAFLAGWGSGMITAAIRNRLRIPNLMAGILTMTMLYSVNIRVLAGRANVSLLKTETFLDRFVVTAGRWGISGEWAQVFFFGVIFFLVRFALDLFFRTDMGITMEALGNNEQMVVSQGVNPKRMKLLGVGFSNGLVGVAGALAALYQGFSDVNSGVGIVVSGLAMVMLGELILPRARSIGGLTFRILLGALVFKGLTYLGRYYGYDINLRPTDLRLLNGLLIVGLLLLTQFKNKRKKRVRA